MREEIPSLPCIICGHALMRDHEEHELQPRDGVMCTTRGNYGSTKVDYMNGEVLHFNICDDCIVQAGERGRVAVCQHTIPVRTETWLPVPERLREEIGRPGRFVFSQVGVKEVDREPVPWNPEMMPSDESEDIPMEYFEEHIDSILANRHYHFHLERFHFESMIQEYHEHLDEV